MMSTEKERCVLCGKTLGEFDRHNPWPLADPAENCCSTCNAERVIPARLSDGSEVDATG